MAGRRGGCVTCFAATAGIGHRVSSYCPGREHERRSVGRAIFLSTVFLRCHGAARPFCVVVYPEQLTSAVTWTDAKISIDHHMEVMDRLSTEAEPPTDTASFLKEDHQSKLVTLVFTAAPAETSSSWAASPGPGRDV